VSPAFSSKKVNISSIGGHKQVWTGVYEESRTNAVTVEKPKVPIAVRNQTQFLIVRITALSERVGPT
jgi:hypothetical protein